MTGMSANVISKSGCLSQSFPVSQFQRYAASLNDRRTGCLLDVSIYLFRGDFA
jgi:hypothetical protein